MAESPSVLATAPAALQDAPSEVVAVEKPVVNGETTVKSPLTTTEDPIVPAASAKATSTVPEPAPIQATTGEPNGTNNVSLNGTTDNSEPLSVDDDTALFSSSLISPEVAALLPEGYTMRPLRRSDYNRGTLLHFVISPSPPPPQTPH